MNDTITSLFVLLLAALGVFVVAMWMATPAGTHEVCLSKHEARQLWPHKHLYWYSSDRCWSNRRGPPRGIKIDKVPAKEAMAKAPEEKSEASADQDHCCWPTLDTDANDNLVEPPASFTQRWYWFPNVFTLFRQRYIP